MAQTAPDLPTRFPCWCRAIYSWGGESKRDLGFIEGDLIECLNAGDGSWWMGRLHRDRRAMGLFPSNFVRVLDDSFIPRSRTASPMPESGHDQKPTPATPKAKNTYRKPFQAYARAGSPNPAAEAQRLEARSRGPSPSPGRHASQTSQSSRYSPSRNPSPYGSRAPSPAPPMHQQPLSRNHSHLSRHEVEPSPPPPPPPPHRTAYNAPARNGPSPTPSMNDRYPAISRGHTPAPPSPGAQGMTPSPLRDAMEDVMSSLHDMSLQQSARSPSPDRSRSPLNPWSPEAFEEFRQKPPLQSRGRPNTSAGFGESYGHQSQSNGVNNGYHQSSGDSDDDEPPYLSNYVQRMESRLRSMHAASSQATDELFLSSNDMGPPPAPPPKNSSYQSRPVSSLSRHESASDNFKGDRRLRNRKSAYELGRQMVGRTFTTKSSATNSSSGAQSTATNGTVSTDMTSQSGFSATSAGSLARRKGFGSIGRRRPMSAAGSRQDGIRGLMNGGSASRPQTPLTSVSYHSSHDSRNGSTRGEWVSNGVDSGGVLGGLTTPKPKKSGFFKKLVDSARTGAASARSSIASGQPEPPRSPVKNLLPSGLNGISGSSAAKDMGLQGGGSAIDWVQVRRDVNRSNSLSLNERTERLERCQMLDQPVLAPVDALFEIAEGGESLDGLPVPEPTNFQATNLQLVDKSARFVNSLPPMTNPMSLAQGYVCRPYKSDVQRLRAIFTWASEKIAWEEDFEGEVDTRRVIQTRRGCAEEVAVLVMEMCSAVGLHAEVVRGYLKVPGEIIEVDQVPRPNHWWNAVLVDGEWRAVDCSLASPTNPKRGQYSSAGSQIAEGWWFLAHPMEICYTHIPSIPEQQHICPPIPFDVLLALPCACPPYFKNELRMKDYDTSLLFLENLELVNIQFTVPSDVECFAEVEARAFVRDADGDLFESGDTVTKRALAQAEWVGGQKRFTVKALLPGDEGHGVLKVYAGKRGLMHSIKDNPHPLAFAVPVIHTGQNPPYNFLLRHPTPHAQRHDLYVAQPQCARLAINNTFVFAVRQHPSSLSCSSPSSAAAAVASTPRSASPLPFARPASAMSFASSSAAAASNSRNDSYFTQDPHGVSSSSAQKPAKLAIQAPSGKILRLTRKGDHVVSTAGGGGETADGGVWETIIKIGEKGTWRGLVLADRSARWCVFGEWECG